MNSSHKPQRTVATAGLAALLLTTIGAIGCMDEFDPSSLIDRARPLGAQVQVQGDPTRATPRPGESATVTWIMAAPADMPQLAWVFAICRWGAANQTEACAGGPYAVAQGTGVPSFLVAVPGDEILAGAPRLALFGQICEAGAPVVDPQSGLMSCTGSGTTVTLDLYIDRSDAPNHNPALAQRPLWFDGVEWAGSPASLDCAGLPVVAAGSKDHAIVLRTLADDRETIVVPAPDPAVLPSTAREVLQISNFTTAGKLDRSFSFVEANDDSPASDVEVTWDAPDTVPPGGLVQLTFVARDLRGGLGYTTRAVCVR